MISDADTLSGLPQDLLIGRRSRKNGYAGESCDAEVSLGEHSSHLLSNQR